jgi:hypothetical protein
MKKKTMATRPPTAMKVTTRKMLSMFSTITIAYSVHRIAYS